MDRSWKGKKVLIVDDSKNMQTELGDLYREIDLDVIGVVSSGLEAIEFVKDKKPDLISMDIVMPEMDGIECYRKIHNMDDRFEFIFVSVLSAEPRVVAHYAKEINADRFLSKPLQRDNLELILNRIFSKKV